MKLGRVIGIALLTAALTACFATANVTELTEGGQKVRTSEKEPPAGYVELEKVTGTHGKGCGRMGVSGTHEGALNALKNAAAELGADFVRIDEDEPPHHTPQCFINEYKLSGMAFRLSDEAPAPAPTPAPTRDVTKMGIERGECYPNNTCNEGLTCASGLCVRLEPAEPPSP